MKIVIDMPENRYEHIMRMQFYIPGSRGGKSLIEEMLTTIRNGTPLPKGHGDLIDRKNLIENGIHKGFCDWYDEIKMADAIIEADTEE